MTIGQSVTLDQLEDDPYPIYERLRDAEPVSWVPAVQLWLVTRYEDVRHVDLTPDVFTAQTTPSTLNRTMGVNMLGSEGPDQERIRRITEGPFRGYRGVVVRGGRGERLVVALTMLRKSVAVELDRPMLRRAQR